MNNFSRACGIVCGDKSTNIHIYIYCVKYIFVTGFKHGDNEKFEVMSDKFNVSGICNSGSYARNGSPTCNL